VNLNQKYHCFAEFGDIVRALMLSVAVTLLKLSPAVAEEDLIGINHGQEQADELCPDGSKGRARLRRR
jgi:hypothetical protein